jgi:hypothetical protein
MGVDFYTCANCERNVPDCGNYFSCSGCYEHFCTNDCGGKQTVQEEGDDEDDDNEYLEEISSCILCRKESITDRDMVRFLLKKSGLTYDQAIAMFREDPEY